MRRLIECAGLLLLVTACKHQSQIGDEVGSAPQTITEAEIAQSQASSAYDAILRLRANFFSNRGKTTILGNSSPLPIVYVDGMEYGTLESLRNIPASQVSTIRLYRAWEATTKFGTGKMGGVIEVITKTE